MKKRVSKRKCLSPVEHLRRGGRLPYTMPSGERREVSYDRTFKVLAMHLPGEVGAERSIFMSLRNLRAWVQDRVEDGSIVFED